MWPDNDQKFVEDIAAIRHLDRIDYVVLNAGILKYPNVRLPPYHHRYPSIDCVASNRSVLWTFPTSPEY